MSQRIWVIEYKRKRAGKLWHASVCSFMNKGRARDAVKAWLNSGEPNLLYRIRPYVPENVPEVKKK